MAPASVFAPMPTTPREAGGAACGGFVLPARLNLLLAEACEASEASPSHSGGSASDCASGARGDGGESKSGAPRRLARRRARGARTDSQALQGPPPLRRRRRRPPHPRAPLTRHPRRAQA